MKSFKLWAASFKISLWNSFKRLQNQRVNSVDALTDLFSISLQNRALLKLVENPSALNLVEKCEHFLVRWCSMGLIGAMHLNFLLQNLQSSFMKIELTGSKFLAPLEIVLYALQWKHWTDTSACIFTVINLPFRKACPRIEKFRDLNPSFCVRAISPGFTAQKPLNQGSHSIKQEATRGQYHITRRHPSDVQTQITSSDLHGFHNVFVQTL